MFSRGAHEGLHLQVLPKRLEKEINLEPILEDGGNRSGAQTVVVGPSGTPGLRWCPAAAPRNGVKCATEQTNSGSVTYLRLTGAVSSVCLFWTRVAIDIPKEHRLKFRTT